MREVYNLEDKIEFEGVGIDTVTRNQGGKTSNSQSTVAKEARPIRTKKPPSKYQDHILYK